jgi:hypothetical protein
MHYVQQLTILENSPVHIYWLDETSVNLWTALKKTWTGTEDPIHLPMQPTRSRSRTVIGAFCEFPIPHVITHVCDRTNSYNVIGFLEKFIAYQR